MNVLAIVLTLGLVFTPSFVRADDVDELKAAHERYLNAWGARDLDVLVEVEGGYAAGFGYTTAFPRKLADKDAHRKSLEQYFANMDVVRVTPQTADYRVVGNTGLVWGYYSQTTKQKSALSTPCTCGSHTLSSNWMANGGSSSITARLSRTNTCGDSGERRLRREGHLLLLRG